VSPAGAGTMGKGRRQRTRPWRGWVIGLALVLALALEYEPPPAPPLGLAAWLLAWVLRALVLTAYTCLALAPATGDPGLAVTGLLILAAALTPGLALGGWWAILTGPIQDLIRRLGTASVWRGHWGLMDCPTGLGST